MAVNERAPYEITRHHHPHYELLYITQGWRRLSVHNRSYAARVGDLIVFRPGEDHAERAGSKSVSFLTLRFKSERLTASGIEFPPARALGPVVRLGKRTVFLDLFAKLLKERDSSEENAGLMMSAYLVEFIVLLRRAMMAAINKARGTSGERSRVKAAIDLIQQNLRRPPRLPDLARKTFMSASHFSHVFKAEVGVSPRQYIVSARLEKAKELLAQTALPAQHIAAVLGYDSPYFFYRQFKQKTGMTALGYRVAQRGITGK